MRLEIEQAQAHGPQLNTSAITDAMSYLETAIRFLPSALSDEQKRETYLQGIELFAQDVADAARQLREGTTAETGESEVQG